MNSIAKATIIAPLIIIVTAVILRFSQGGYQSGAVNNVAISLPPASPKEIEPSIADFKNAMTKELSRNSLQKLNLKGPLSCSYADTETDTKLFILDRQGYAKFKSETATHYFLINGDCGYKWTEGEKQGIKICKINQYLSLFETVSSLPFFSTEMLLSFLPGIDEESSESFNRDNIAKVIQSCTKKTIDESLFEIPRGIQFIEQKISGTPEDFLNQ